MNADSDESLKNTIIEAAQNRLSNIILSFMPLDHMNSDGASALVKTSELAKQHKIKLFAYGLNARYREIFNVTGISRNITVLSDLTGDIGGLSKAEVGQTKENTDSKGRQDDNGWSPNLLKLRVTEKPKGAINKNVDGRRVVGPLQGFGPIWQKTYWLTVDKPELKPAEVINIMKQHFPEFQPSYNRFYPSSGGITEGNIVLIDSLTPGGLVSTGVLVLYSDELSFTLMTPHGHPEAGWVTFSARESGKAIILQIQGLASASDPFYEFAFRIAGSKLQESIWKYVLSSLAAHIGIASDVKMAKTCISPRLKWANTGNLWHNAQIRSLPYNLTRIFSR
ncbi:STAS domain-containing protein [Chloroflexota bacterium]